MIDSGMHELGEFAGVAMCITIPRLTSGALMKVPGYGFEIPKVGLPSTVGSQGVTKHPALPIGH